MNNSIEVFSEKNQLSCVKEIISTLKHDDLPPSSFKVDFKLSKGRMISEEDNNTVLSFDTKENTSLRSIIDYICEVEDVTDEDIKLFESFRSGVIDKLNKEDEKNEIRDILREKVFKGTPKEVVPIEVLEVRDVEISDLPEIDYVLVVKKMAPANYQGSSISDDLFTEKQNTGDDFDDIIKRKKEAGDERYKYVDGVEVRKTFFEITIPLFADYSLKELSVSGNDS
ncbi:hypothetical protein CMI47_18370 [Candidatus Pacearchaeota archaeon]|jgi:hypothetical protein|nr:hypothetical protein [Candidatus Pacearchaeota archaeon]|tara:strand:- start:6473 stop:7150 length:678 start_codon:yes stop_codon:yes gene_type:complete